MDFAFSTEQDELRTEARRSIERLSPVAAVREHFEDDGFDPAVMASLVEQGWTGFGVPEEDGGFGDLLDLTVVLEELGRTLVPGPFASTMAVAVPVLAAASGSDAARRALERIVGGEGWVATAWAEKTGTWSLDGFDVTLESDGDRLTLRGTKLFVQDAGAAGSLLVAATDPSDGSTVLVLVPADAQGVSIESMRSLDTTRPLFAVTFDSVSLSGDGVIAQGAEAEDALRAGRRGGLVGQCAELIGSMAAVLERCVEYAKQRVQFGKPIGAYQGVSHVTATMLMMIESSRSVTYYAAWAATTGAADADRAASVAKAFVGDAARWVAGMGVQVHGGIGFTWEHDMHLYFKRAKGYEVLFGDTSLHRDLVAEADLAH